MSTPDNRVLEEEELLTALAGLGDWSCEEGRLRARFAFADFPSAMAFMTRCAFTAEALNHHPNWSNVYNRVDVEIWSHDLGGISQLCLALAAAMSRAASGLQSA